MARLAVALAPAHQLQVTVSRHGRRRVADARSLAYVCVNVAAAHQSKKEGADKFDKCMRACVRAHYAHICARVMN